jgi:RNA polymerase sigma-70 factor (ECF subfamily)
MERKSENQELSVRIRNQKLTALIQNHCQRAFQYALSFCGNPDEAKDLVQEALFKTLSNWKRYNNHKPLEIWFLAILKNAFLDSRKRYDCKHVISLEMLINKEQSGNIENLLPSRESEPLEQLEKQEILLLSQKALKNLNQEHQQIILLCVLEGKKYGNVSQILAVPLGTVRSRLSRAKQRLRNCFSELANWKR